MKWRQTTFQYVTPATGECGPQFNVSSDGWGASAQVFVEGTPSVLYQAFKDFLGYSSVGNKAGTKFVKRVLPHSMPGFDRTGGTTGRSILWCNSVSVDAQVTPTGHEHFNGRYLPSFQWARLTLRYTSLRYKLLEDNDPAVTGVDSGWAGIPDESLLTRYVFHIRKPSVRVITAPQGTFYFRKVENDDTSILAAFGVPINESGADVTIRWIDVPEIPDANIARGLGTVNRTKFFEYEPETLVMMPPDYTPTVQADGTTAYSIDYKFNFNPKVARTAAGGATAGRTQRGHNWFLRRYNNGAGYLLDYRPLDSKDTTDTVGVTPLESPPYRRFEFKWLFRLKEAPNDA